MLPPLTRDAAKGGVPPILSCGGTTMLYITHADTAFVRARAVHTQILVSMSCDVF